MPPRLQPHRLSGSSGRPVGTPPSSLNHTSGLGNTTPVGGNTSASASALRRKPALGTANMGLKKKPTRAAMEQLEAEEELTAQKLIEEKLQEEISKFESQKTAAYEEELKRHKFEEELERVDIPKHEPSLLQDVLLRNFGDLMMRPIVPELPSEPTKAQAKVKDDVTQLEESDEKEKQDESITQSQLQKDALLLGSSKLNVSKQGTGAAIQSPSAHAHAQSSRQATPTASTLQPPNQVPSRPVSGTKRINGGIGQHSTSANTGSRIRSQPQPRDIPTSSHSSSRSRLMSGSRRDPAQPYVAQTQKDGSYTEDDSLLSQNGFSVIRKEDDGVAEKDETAGVKAVSAIEARNPLPLSLLDVDTVGKLRSLEEQAATVEEGVQKSLKQVVEDLKSTISDREIAELDSLSLFGVPPPQEQSASQEPAIRNSNEVSRISQLTKVTAPKDSLRQRPTAPIRMPTPLLAMHRNELRKSLERLAYLSNPRFKPIPVHGAPISRYDHKHMATTQPLSLVATTTPSDRVAVLAEKRFGSKEGNNFDSILPKSVRSSVALTMRPEWTNSPFKPRPTYVTMSSLSPEFSSLKETNEMSVKDFFSVSPEEVLFSSLEGAMLGGISNGDSKEELVARVVLRNVSSVSRRARVLPMRAPFFRAILLNSPSAASKITTPIETLQRGTGLIAPGLHAEVLIYFRATSHALVRDTLIIETDAGRILVPVIANAETSEIIGLPSLFQFKPSPPLLAGESSFRLTSPNVSLSQQKKKKQRFYLCDVDQEPDVQTALESEGLPETSSFNIDTIFALYEKQTGSKVNVSLEECERWFDLWLSKERKTSTNSLDITSPNPLNIAISQDSEAIVKNLVVPYMEAVEKIDLVAIIALERFAGFVCGDEDVISRTEDTYLQALSLSRSLSAAHNDDSSSVINQQEPENQFTIRMSFERRARLFAIHRLRRSVISSTLAKRHMEEFIPGSGQSVTRSPSYEQSVPYCQYFSLASWTDSYEQAMQEGRQMVKKIYRKRYTDPSFGLTEPKSSKGQFARPDSVLLTNTFAVAPRCLELESGESVDMQIVSWPSIPGHHMATVALIADNGDFALISLSAAAHEPALSLVKFGATSLDVQLVGVNVMNDFPGINKESPIPIDFGAREVGSSIRNLLILSDDKNAAPEQVDIAQQEIENEEEQGFVSSFVVQNTSLLSLPFRCSLEPDESSDSYDMSEFQNILDAFEVSPASGVFEAHSAVRFSVRFAPYSAKHTGLLRARLALKLNALPSHCDYSKCENIPDFGKLKPFSVPEMMEETEDERDARYAYLRAKRNASALTKFLPGKSTKRVIVELMNETTDITNCRDALSDVDWSTDDDDDENDDFDNHTDNDIESDTAEKDRLQGMYTNKGNQQSSGWKLVTGERINKDSKHPLIKTELGEKQCEQSSQPDNHRIMKIAAATHADTTSASYSSSSELPLLYVSLQGMGQHAPISISPAVVSYGPGALVVGAESRSDVFIENSSENLFLLFKPMHEEWLNQPLPLHLPLPVSNSKAYAAIQDSISGKACNDSSVIRDHLEMFSFSLPNSPTSASPRGFATSSWLCDLRSLCEQHLQAQEGNRAPLTIGDLVEAKILAEDGTSPPVFAVPPRSRVCVSVVLKPKVPLLFTPSTSAIPIYTARLIYGYENRLVSGFDFDLKEPVWPLVPCSNAASRNSASISSLMLSGSTVSGQAVFVDSEVNFGVVNASFDRGNEAQATPSATARFRIRNVSNAPVPFVLVAQPGQGGNPLGAKSHKPATVWNSADKAGINMIEGLRFVPSRGVLAPNETRVVEAIFRTPATAAAIAQDLDCIVELHSAGSPDHHSYLRAVASVKLPSVRLLRVVNGTAIPLVSNAGDVDLERPDQRVDVGTRRVVEFLLENSTPLDTPFAFNELPISDIGLKMPTTADGSESGLAEVTLEPLSGVLLPNESMKITLTIVGLIPGFIQKLFALEVRGLSASTVAPPLIALRGLVKPVRLSIQPLAPAHTKLLIKSGLVKLGQAKALVDETHLKSNDHIDAEEIVSSFPTIAESALKSAGFIVDTLTALEMGGRQKTIDLGEDIDVSECVFRDVLISNLSECPIALAMNFNNFGPIPDALNMSTQNTSLRGPPAKLVTHVPYREGITRSKTPQLTSEQLGFRSVNGVGSFTPFSGTSGSGKIASLKDSALLKAQHPTNADLCLPPIAGVSSSKFNIADHALPSTSSSIVEIARIELNQNSNILRCQRSREKLNPERAGLKKTLAIPKLTGEYETKARFSSAKGQAWLAQTTAEAAAREVLSRSGKSAVMWTRVVGSARIATVETGETSEPVATNEAWEGSAKFADILTPRSYPSITSLTAGENGPSTSPASPLSSPSPLNANHAVPMSPRKHSPHHGHSKSMHLSPRHSETLLAMSKGLNSAIDNVPNASVMSTQLGPEERVPHEQPSILLPPRSIVLVRLYARADTASYYSDDLRVSAKVDLSKFGVSNALVDESQIHVQAAFSGLSLKYCTTTTPGIILAPQLAMTLTRALIRSLPFPQALSELKEKAQLAVALKQSLSSTAISLTLAGSETPLGSKSCTDESLSQEQSWFTVDGARKALDVKLGLRLDRTYAPMDLTRGALAENKDSDTLTAASVWARALLPAIPQNLLSYARGSLPLTKGGQARLLGGRKSMDEDDLAQMTDSDVLVALAGLPLTPLFAQAGQLGKLIQRVLLPEADPCRDPAQYAAALKAIEYIQTKSSSIADADAPDLPGIQIADPVELHTLLRALRSQAEAEPVWGPCFPLLPWRLSDHLANNYTQLHQIHGQNAKVSISSQSISHSDSDSKLITHFIEKDDDSTFHSSSKLHRRKIRIINEGAKPVMLTVRAIDLASVDGYRCVSLSFKIGGCPYEDLAKILSENAAGAIEDLQLEGDELGEAHSFIPSDEGMEYFFDTDEPRKCVQVWYPLPHPSISYCAPFDREPPPPQSAPSEQSVYSSIAMSPLSHPNSIQQRGSTPQSTRPQSSAAATMGRGRQSNLVHGGLSNNSSITKSNSYQINPAHLTPFAAEQNLAAILSSRAAERAEKELSLTNADGSKDVSHSNEKRDSEFNRKLQKLSKFMSPSRPHVSPSSPKMGMFVWVDVQTRIPLIHRKTTACESFSTYDSQNLIGVIANLVDWQANATDVTADILSIDPAWVSIQGGKAATITLTSSREAVMQKGGIVDTLLLPYVNNNNEPPKLLKYDKATQSNRFWSSMQQQGYQKQDPLRMFVRIEVPDVKNLLDVGVLEKLNPFTPTSQKQDATMSRVRQLEFSVSAPMTPCNEYWLVDPVNCPYVQTFPITNRSLYVPLRVVMSLKNSVPLSSSAFSLYVDNFSNSTGLPPFTGARPGIVEVILPPGSTCHVNVQFSPPSPSNVSAWPLSSSSILHSKVNIVACSMSSRRLGQALGMTSPLYTIDLKASLYRRKLDLNPPNGITFGGAPIAHFPQKSKQQAKIKTKGLLALSEQKLCDDMEINWNDLRASQIRRITIQCPIGPSGHKTVAGAPSVVWRIVHLQDSERTPSATAKRLLKQTTASNDELQKSELKAAMSPSVLRTLSNPDLNPDRDFIDDASVFIFSNTWGVVNSLSEDSIELDPCQGPSTLPTSEKQVRVAFVPTRPIKYKSRFALIATNAPYQKLEQKSNSETLSVRRQSMIAKEAVLTSPSDVPFIDMTESKIKDLLEGVSGRASAPVITGMGPVQAVITLEGYGSISDTN